MTPARLAALFLCVAAVPAAGAADWTFDPALTLLGEKTGAPEFVGASGETDTMGRATLHLKLTGATPRTTGVFTYEPSYEWHRKFTQLDNLSHFASFDWEHLPSQRTRWQAAGSWSLTNRPRLGFETPGVAEVALPGTRMTFFGATLAGRFSLSQRSRLVVELQGRASRIGESQPQAPGAQVTLTNSSEVDLTTGWEWNLSPVSTAGLEYRGSRIDEGDHGTIEVHRVLATYSHGQEDRLLFRLRAGGAKPRVVDQGQEQFEAPSSEFVGEATLIGAVGRRSRMEGGVRRDLSWSGGTVGAAVDESVYLSWTTLWASLSRLSLLARLTRLDPIGQQAETSGRITTQSYRGEFAPALGQHWSLVFSGEYIDQSAPQEPVLTLSYTVWGVGVRWAPTAREASARR